MIKNDFLKSYLKPSDDDIMVGPQDGGFRFDQSKKYTSVDNLEKVCVQCQAGQHKNCLAKTKKQPSCDCEHCLIYG